MNTLYGLALIGIVGFWVWAVFSYLKERGKNQ